MVRKYRRDEIPNVYNLSEVPRHDHGLGATQRYFRGIDTMIGVTTVTEEKERPELHSHPWEQLCYVLEGSGEFRVSDETIAVESGDVFFVPPDVPHCVQPPEETLSIMFVGPLREAQAQKTEYQREF